MNVYTIHAMANSKSEHDPLMDFEVVHKHTFNESKIQLGPRTFR